MLRYDPCFLKSKDALLVTRMQLWDGGERGVPDLGWGSMLSSTIHNAPLSIESVAKVHTDSVVIDGLLDLFGLQAGGRSAGPAHMNSASSAKEAIRLMEADKDKERERDRDASMRSASRDRDGRPRERGSDRGR